MMLNSAKEANGCEGSKPLTPAMEKPRLDRPGELDRVPFRFEKRSVGDGLAPVLAVGADVDGVILDPPFD